MASDPETTYVNEYLIKKKEVDIAKTAYDNAVDALHLHRSEYRSNAMNRFLNELDNRIYQSEQNGENQPKADIKLDQILPLDPPLAESNDELAMADFELLQYEIQYARDEDEKQEKKDMKRQARIVEREFQKAIMREEKMARKQEIANRKRARLTL